jgi:DNA-binding MarR family transcriptional regulator
MPRAVNSLASPLHLLHRTSQGANSHFAGNVGAADLTPRVADSGLSQTDIMAATGIDRSSTADLVRRLVANGSLQRRRTRRDARLYAVRIRPHGHELLGIGAAATRAAEVALLLSVPEQQRQVFLEVLTSIATALDT